MKYLLLATTALALSSAALPTFAASHLTPNDGVETLAPTTPSDLPPQTSSETTEVVITARRRLEKAQDVPLSVSVYSGAQLAATGTTSVEQLVKLQPSIQFVSSNPRNTAVTIRGIGSNTGLTNDGLENGVGIYVDEVYYARPGSATVDLFDLDRLEVLRGPQGTLFGKNTTAGALSMTTSAPTFDPYGYIEVTGGNYGYLQTKAALSGALLGDKVAGRIAVISTKRDGLYYNTTTKNNQDDKNSQALRAQLLIYPTEALKIRVIYDYAYQDPEANTQAFVRYGPTQRPANTQFPALSALFNYKPASTNPYDRLVDVNSPIQARQILQGLSAIVNYDLGKATFTSVSGVRYWDWTPQNDRDYTSLSIRTRSANNSGQSQWSQEFRLSSNGKQKLDWVVGAYGFGQNVKTNGSEEWGKDAARWLVNTTVPSDLLTGYLASTNVLTDAASYALFGQATYNLTEKLHLTGGLRYTYEEKSIDYQQIVSGGLATTDAALITRKNGVARNQAYKTDFVDQSPSGQVSIGYDFTQDILGYFTVTKGYKSGGLNAAGIPTDVNGNPSLTSAYIRPENTSNLELGLKSQVFDRKLTLNLAAYATDIEDYQANVVDSGPGSLRGYLANVEKVTVRGLEFESFFRPNSHFNLFATLSYTDGRYDSFKNGPPPLENLTATTQAFDLSGKRLPGVSEWAGAYGFEYKKPATLGKISGQAIIGLETSFRTNWYSDASVSAYSLIEGSSLTNLRVGFRSNAGIDTTFWVKNAFDEQYLNFTSIQAGNSGAIYGQPGDPRTFGVTIKKEF